MDPLPSVGAVLAKLNKLGIPVPAGAVRVDAYGDSPELSESLLALIRSGRKRAGTSLLWGMEAEGEELPVPGQIELVVDHLNEPALVCRITEVQTVPFNEVTAEYAAIEGEGDGSLEYWREGHWAFFSRECRRIGREPDVRMPVVCSVFEVLSVVPGRVAQREATSGSAVELLPMQRTVDDSEVAFVLKRDALGPHIIARWGWDEAYQRAVHAQRWGSKHFFRIVQDGATVGTVAVDEEQDHVRVGEFYVATAHQNQGIGSAVLRPILHHAAERHLPVRLECLKWNPALSFYKRHGFVVTGESEIHFFLERVPKDHDS